MAKTLEVARTTVIYIMLILTQICHLSQSTPQVRKEGKHNYIKKRIGKYLKAIL